MQKTDLQRKKTGYLPNSDRVGEGSENAVNIKGCISKGDICQRLRPNLSRYQSYVVREFFTPDRLKACGISPDQFKTVRVFPPDASAFIISELQRLNFL